MRKILLSLFLLCTGIKLFAQPECDRSVLKISYPGKAPWNIDGSISDWETLLGPPSNLFITTPFLPPDASIFNYTHDLAEDDFPFGTLSEKNLIFLAYTHDDYNVYFYLRRIVSNGNTNTFLYFIDVDGDGLMDESEPVISASFNNNTISALKLSRYIPSPSYYFVPGRGNYLSPPQNWPAPDPNVTPGHVTKFALPGNLVEVFNSAAIPKKNKLKKNEVFSAALTEGGLGVELSIPWRYLRFWLKPEIDDDEEDTGGKEAGGENAQSKDASPARQKPLKPGDLFFYHVSILNGAGPYLQANVVENAGSCCNNLGVSINPLLNKVVKNTTIIPGASYKMRITYTNKNKQNITLFVDTVVIKSNPAPGSIPDPSGAATLILYTDKNCNGRVDPGETGVIFTPYFDPDVNHFVHFPSSTPSYIFAANDKLCHLLLLTFPPGATITNGSIKLYGGRFFSDLYYGGCDGGGGKSVNQVGIVEEEIGEEPAGRGVKINDQVQEMINESVRVYPNPSKGTINIALPKFEGTADILVQDISGRTVKHISGVTSRNSQVKDLQPGFYILKVTLDGKESIKKVIIQ